VGRKDFFLTPIKFLDSRDPSTKLLDFTDPRTRVFTVATPQCHFRDPSTTIVRAHYKNPRFKIPYNIFENLTNFRLPTTLYRPQHQISDTLYNIFMTPYKNGLISDTPGVSIRIRGY